MWANGPYSSVNIPAVDYEVLTFERRIPFRYAARMLLRVFKLKLLIENSLQRGFARADARVE